MNTRYRPPRSGKRSLAIAVIAPVVLAAGVYVALDKPSIPVPVVVEPPDNAQRHTKSEPLYRPTPLPKATPLLSPAEICRFAIVGSRRFQMRGVKRCGDVFAISVRARPTGRHKTDIRRILRSVVDQRERALTNSLKSSRAISR